MISYFYFEKLHPYHRAILTIATIALLLFFWFTFVYKNLQKKIAIQETKFENIIKQQNLIRTYKNECVLLQKSMNAIQKNIDAGINHSNPNMATAIEYARETGLLLQSCNAMEKEEAELLLNKQPIVYEFSGNIDQTIQFCKKLKECQKLLTCDQITITTGENKNCNIRCKLALFSL